MALAQMNGGHEVCFVDCVPLGQSRPLPEGLSELPNLRHRTHYYSARGTGMPRLVLDRLRFKLERAAAGISGAALPGALSPRAIGLEKVLSESPADVYMGHSIDSLLPLYRAARKHRAVMVFDSMEFHSDTGDGQSPWERRLIRRIEARVLPACRLVTTSSPEVADELARQYGLKNLLPLYNTPPLQERLPGKPDRGFSLYWRNAVVGLGQRGLDDALQALRLLPGDIKLHLQGKRPFDGGSQLEGRLSELGIRERVILHPPFLPHEAVNAASAYTVGLCLERRGVRNQHLTVSNKIFDYLMAGLVVVASDMDGLASVIRRSGGGVLFQSGNVEDLAARIRFLYDNPAALKRMAESARGFALREGNRESEMLKFEKAFSSILKSPVDRAIPTPAGGLAVESIAQRDRP